jgi:hypothetical protein
MHQARNGRPDQGSHRREPSELQGRVVGQGRSCCLDNRWARVSQDGTVTVLARREKGVIQIGTVTYEPRAGEMTLTMKNGARTAMKAGAGVEQWEP